MAASNSAGNETLLETVYYEAIMQGVIEPENLVGYLKDYLSQELGIDDSTGEATFISMKLFQDLYTSNHEHLLNSSKHHDHTFNGVSRKLIINVLQKKADPRTNEEMLFCLCCHSFLNPPMVLHPCGHLSCGSCYMGPNSYDGRDTCRIHKCGECECGGIDEKAAETIKQTNMMKKYSQVQEWVRGLQKFQHDPTIGPLIARYPGNSPNEDSGFEDGGIDDTSASSDELSSRLAPSHPSSSSNSSSNNNGKIATKHKRLRSPSPAGVSVETPKSQPKKRKITSKPKVVPVFKAPHHNVFHAHGTHTIKLESEINEGDIPISDASDSTSFCKGTKDHWTTDDGICMACGENVIEEKTSELSA